MESGGRKKTVVLSGINLFEGGPLSIYFDCLDAIRDTGIWKDNKIIAFVHKKDLFSRYAEFVTIIELPKSRENYINRLFYEYIYFNFYSKNIPIDVWISLHDMTPRVKARRIYTYCHSPAPFLQKDLLKIRYSWKIVLASIFYDFFYKINIRTTEAVIVQQDWMRQEFKQRYPVNEVIVARPRNEEKREFCDRSGDNKVFIFASYPRFFKNFEVILNATRIMEKHGIDGFEIWITIDGSENKYSKELKEKFSDLSCVQWMGLLKREELFKKYEQAHCLIFPSKLETWGLPISEFKETGKPILLADLPYAHETIGEYDLCSFFNPNNPEELASMMADIISGEIQYQSNKEIVYEQPYAQNWEELLNICIRE